MGSLDRSAGDIEISVATGKYYDNTSVVLVRIFLFHEHHDDFQLSIILLHSPRLPLHFYVVCGQWAIPFCKHTPPMIGVP